MLSTLKNTIKQYASPLKLRDLLFLFFNCLSTVNTLVNTFEQTQDIEFKRLTLY